MNLKIEDKELVVLLGPSGCGKTTTMRMIAGLEVPTSGNIYIGDVLVNDLPPKDRDVAMVFQSYALYPHMTVFDNIAFPLKLRKVPKDKLRERVRNTAELLQISHLLDRKPKQLSGGEMQRVALGRAIVREPKVFLMDEPLSNLDAKLRVYMRAELKALQRRIGITTIYVTHDQVEAMTMADRVALMNKGLLNQIAHPIEIYHKPTNRFVAGFVGSPPTNFVDCSLVEKNGKAYLDAGTFQLDITDLASIVKEKATSSEVTIGIRPEDISASKTPRQDDIMQGKVYVIEPLGAEIIIDTMVGETMVRAVAPPDFKVDMGDDIYLFVNKQKMHIFDRKTEVAIT
jgi:multiple sugar transport system ATP-binding protein